GGDDGLQCYRDIAKIAPKLLKDNGYILLEVGYNQANDVKNIFQNKSFNFINFRQDLSGINRCVVLKKVDRKL
ncbi:MAG: protein-(glutamine-N5) methyltransferase, release factor-specific, partial [Alphaproteobacteria bacterium]|nr:protein-(glutamine-N5) methyltransferase, release factor-specific [Alphaproteobacteria bacterium]